METFMVSTCWKWVGSVTQLVKFNLKQGCLYMIFRAENQNYKPIRGLLYCPDILHLKSDIVLAKFKCAKCLKI